MPSSRVSKPPILAASSSSRARTDLSRAAISSFRWASDASTRPFISSSSSSLTATAASRPFNCTESSSSLAVCRFTSAHAASNSLSRSATQEAFSSSSFCLTRISSSRAFVFFGSAAASK